MKKIFEVEIKEISTSGGNALLKIIEQQGNKTSEEAKKFLEHMEEDGRYEKDVY